MKVFFLLWLLLWLALGAPSRAAAETPTAVAVQPGEPALRPPQHPADRLVLEPARLEDGQNLRLPPLVIAQERSGKDRAVIWIGGLLVLAAAFLWNRSRRQELERQELASSKRSADGDGSSSASADGGDSSSTSAPSSDPGRPSKEP